MRILLKSLFIIIFSVCVVQMGHAHRFYAAFTQIDLRDKKQTIEVVHRLFTHDVEDLLRIKSGNAASMGDVEVEYILREFIEANFAIFDNQGERLSLAWIGMEFETADVLLYQESPLPSAPSTLTIINRLFMELFDDQKNTVNVEWNKQIRTNIFVKGNEQQKVSFKAVE